MTNEERAAELEAEANRVLEDCPSEIPEVTRLYLQRTLDQANRLRYPWEN